jgi:NAD(P)-dependent dehydrogenase (short-subunit alcohol dehydrogenase family)
VLARSAHQIKETVRLVEAAGGQAMAVPADVTSSAAVRNAFEQIETTLGPVTLLVNNAGDVKPFGPLWETDVEEWWHSLEVNLHGPLLCTRAVLPGMVTRREGRIINVASGAATLSTPYYSSYIASKTALIRFTECLALETRPHNVAFFAISPGTVRTEMTEYSLNSNQGKKWLPWFAKIFEHNIDVPAEHAAQLVVNLAAGRADALSGRMLSVYDDLEVLLKNSAYIEERNLYSLKMEKLAEAGGNPELAAVLAEARRAADPKK